jgi:hypothetical protein
MSPHVEGVTEELDPNHRRADDPVNPDPSKDERFDLDEPRYQPFDWFTLAALIDRALEAARRSARRTTELLASERKQQAAEDSGRGFAQRAGARVFGRKGAAPDRQTRIDGLQWQIAADQRLFEEVDRLRSDVATLRAGHPWSVQSQQPILDQLKAIRVPYISTKTHTVESDGLADAAYAQRWLSEYNADRHRRFLALQSAGSADPPAVVREYFEPRWRFDASCEVGRIGAEYGNYTDGSSLDDEVTLLEIPSSRIFGWLWDDANRPSVIIKKDDLKGHDFSRVRMAFGTAS